MLLTRISPGWEQLSSRIIHKVENVLMIYIKNGSVEYRAARRDWNFIRAFNSFMNTLTDMTKNLKRISISNKNIGENLAVNTTQISSSTTEIGRKIRRILKKWMRL